MRIIVLTDRRGYTRARTAADFCRDEKDLQQMGFRRLMSFNIPRRVKTPWPVLYRSILPKLILWYDL